MVTETSKSKQTLVSKGESVLTAQSLRYIAFEFTYIYFDLQWWYCPFGLSEIELQVANSVVERALFTYVHVSRNLVSEGNLYRRCLKHQQHTGFIVLFTFVFTLIKPNLRTVRLVCPHSAKLLCRVLWQFCCWVQVFY